MLRFAPSPTGEMHIEALRIAILNYMLAKQRDVNFIVRIDDRDKMRNLEGKDTEILQILEKFALPHSRVSHQSENLHIHQTLAIRLLEEKKAFVCLCTPEEIASEEATAHASNLPYRYSGRCSTIGAEELARLKEEKQPFVIRVKTPETPVSYHDLIEGEIPTPPDGVDSFIILREDATPSYNFACACDDMLAGVSLVMRGEEHRANTPKQHYIKNLLGYREETRYAHLPRILNTEGRPMVEGEEASSVKWLFEQGFIPDAIVNYLILLGNQTPTEIFTMPEALAWFDLTKLSKEPVKFDINKLRFLNRKHLEMMDDRTLSTLFGFADRDIGKLAKLYLEKASTINELQACIKPIFAPKEFCEAWGEEMQTLRDIIADAPMISTYDAFESYLKTKSQLEGEAFAHPLRLLLTGRTHGPKLSAIYPFIQSYLLEVAS